MINEAYTQAFCSGMLAAANSITRERVLAIAKSLPVSEGDAYIAGYYAELRKRREEQR